MECQKPNWSWIVVLGSFVAFFIADGWSYTFGMLYPELIIEFGESKGATAYVPTLLYGIPMILSPFACSAVSVVGCRALGIFGGLVFSLSLILVMISNSLWAVCLVVGILSSTGLVALYISAFIAVTYWFDEGTRGLATGIAVAGSGVGSIVFPHLLDLLMPEYLWRGTVLIVAGISLNAVISGCLYRPFPSFGADVNEDSALKEVSPEGDGLAKAGNGKPDGKPLRVFTEVLRGSLPDCNLLRSNIFRLYGCANFVLYLWVSVPYLYVYDWAIHDAKLDHFRSAWLLSAIGISRTVGQIVVGLVGDRKGVSPNFLLGVCVAVTGISTFFMPLLENYALPLSCCIAFGFAVSSTYVLPMLCLGETIGIQRGVAGLGLLQFVQGIATLSGTPIGGWIHDARGSYDTAFMVSGSLMLVSAVLFCIIPVLLKKDSCKFAVHDKIAASDTQAEASRDILEKL